MTPSTVTRPGSFRAALASSRAGPGNWPRAVLAPAVPASGHAGPGNWPRLCRLRAMLAPATGPGCAGFGPCWPRLCRPRLCRLRAVLASAMDVFDDWETKQGGRGRNRRLGVQIRALDGRFRRLGDQNGRFRRLGDRKRRPIVQNVHEAHQMTPNREKRPKHASSAPHGAQGQCVAHVAHASHVRCAPFSRTLRTHASPAATVTCA